MSNTDNDAWHEGLFRSLAIKSLLIIVILIIFIVIIIIPHSFTGKKPIYFSNKKSAYCILLYMFV